MAYNSAYTGSQIDAAVGAVREKKETWDSKAAKSQEITVTLSADGWADGAQTVQDAALLAGGYCYLPAAIPDHMETYAACMVRGDNVTVDGEMTFHCGDTPTTVLSVNILRIEVEEDG